MIGETVEGFNSHNAVGSTEYRPLLNRPDLGSFDGNAVKYFIPLTSNGTCTYGVDCGTVSDSGSGGTTMSVYLKFDPDAASNNAALNVLFEDLDLKGANDPDYFYETVQIFDAFGNSLTPLIDDIWNDGVTGNKDTQQLLSYAIGPITESPFWLRLEFTSSYKWEGRNTPEYLIANVASVPEPSSLALLAAGLAAMRIVRRRA